MNIKKFEGTDVIPLSYSPLIHTDVSPLSLEGSLPQYRRPETRGGLYRDGYQDGALPTHRNPSSEIEEHGV